LDEDNEKLIAKIQLEYKSGTSIDIAKDLADWDIGLLYFTTNNLWFINSTKSKAQISFPDIIDINNVKQRKSKKKTKFTKVLQAKYVMNIDFRTVIEDRPAIYTIQLSAAKGILKALRSQLQIRLEQKTTKKKGSHNLDKNELLQRLGVLLHIKINDDEQLKFFLGLDDRELVNLMLERNRILQKNI